MAAFLLIRQFPKIPLRLVLVVPFVLQVTVAVGLTGWVSLQNGKQAIHELATKLRAETSERVEQHLDSYLTVPQQLNQTIAHAIANDLLPQNDFQTLGQLFWQQVRLFDVSFINYGLLTGEYIGAGYFTENDTPEDIIITETSARTGWVSTDFTTDGQGNRLEASTHPNYDYREEAWYTAALAARRPVWSEIYLWDDDPNMIAIAASQPLYNSKGELIGAFGVDLLLSRISDFLRQIRVSPSGHVFIVEQSGDIVASSSPELPYRLDANKVAQRLRAVDSQEPAIRLTAQHLVERFGSFRQVRGDHQLEFWAGREHYFVQVQSWNQGKELDWLVVIVVPESDFMMQIQANTRTTLLLCGLSLFGSVLLGLWTARWITQPILRLSQASRAIAQGNWQRPVPGMTPIAELGVMARSFNQMAQQLRDAFDQVHSALQASEEKFSKAFHCSPDAICIRTLAEGRFLEVNDSFCRMTGYTAAEILGQTYETSSLWIAPEDCEDFVRTLKEKGSVSNREITFRHRSGELRTGLFSAELIHLMGETCILSMAKDISDRKQAETEILKALAREKELSELKSRFVSMVSHEFRTPLTTIQSSAELLEYYDWTAEERQIQFGQIKDAVHQMTQLLEDVLLIGKIEAGKLEPKPVVFDLVALCQEVLQEMQYQSPTPDSIAFIVTGEPQMVFLDPKLMRQILSNLLSNAVKYSPTSDPIELQVIYAADCVTLRVRDEGIGIPAEALDHLFEPFFRASNAETIQGTGLGLAIVKKCVELQNGHIWVESQVNVGTTFTITLPNDLGMDSDL